jgi:hypothetical protein
MNNQQARWRPYVCQKCFHHWAELAKDADSSRGCQRCGTLCEPLKWGGDMIDKKDQDKPRYDLIPFHALDEVVQVLTYGAKKYSPDNWRTIPDRDTRYLAASLRHITAHARGELVDPESGMSHLAHAVCCLLFMME